MPPTCGGCQPGAGRVASGPVGSSQAKPRRKPLAGDSALFRLVHRRSAALGNFGLGLVLQFLFGLTVAVSVFLAVSGGFYFILGGILSQFLFRLLVLRRRL